MRGILQEPIEGTGKTRCNVCAFRCELSEGQVGMCRVRHNQGGAIEYLAEDNALGAVCPMVETCGAGLHCIGGARGCNWSCSFCSSGSVMNPEFAPAQKGQIPIPLTSEGFLDKKALRGNVLPIMPASAFKGRNDTPDEIVARWKDSGRGGLGIRGDEPSIHVEQVIPIFKQVRAEGGFVFINTNGYWTPELLEVLAPWVDVVNVGVKGSANARFLRKVAGVPKTEPIFETIKGLVARGRIVTVTDLPVYHDDWEDDFKKLCGFVASEIPARDYPRLTISPLSGLVASSALGEFQLGFPTNDPKRPNRVSFLYRAIELALPIVGELLMQHFGGLSTIEESALRAALDDLPGNHIRQGEAELLKCEAA